jgi:PhnB protein
VISYDPAKGFPRIAVELVYDDVAGAIDWLGRVFGFGEILRHVGEGGRIGHADLELEGGIVMLRGAGAGYRAPGPDGPSGALTVVFVADVDGHYDRARAQGATILAAPEDKPWGLRSYTARDHEGHTWQFSRHLRDVPPAEWGAVVR